MRIAHLSDLHLLDLEGAVPSRLFNKRFTGWVNIKLKRGHHHKPAPVRAAATEIERLGVDHVVITGDVSNLSLEREFDRVKDVLEHDLGLAADRISVVPGNHDAYTRGAVRAGRFAQWFAPFMKSDLPELTGATGFPYVRLRGPVAIIGLSTAVARPPLVASGELGDAQLAALGRALAHPEVSRRTVVILQHHPIHNPPSRAKTLLEGLVDADQELALLSHLERGLVLHGHLHRRIHRTVETVRGTVDAVGSTSASLLHEDLDRMAGFNIYTFDEKGSLQGVDAMRFDERSSTFVEASVPKH
jgi:3',5'-cyclic AMP phosphodiesterase CpdA